MTKATNGLKRVAITGCGVISSLGCNDEHHAALMRGETGIKQLASNTKCSQASVGGVLLNVEVDRSTRVAEFSHRVVEHALLESGLDATKSFVGLSFGSAVAASLEIEQAYIGRTRLRAADFRFGTTSDDLASHFSLRGPRFTLSTGCVAGLDAIGVALDQIRLGNSTSMIAVASDAPLCPIVIAAFDRIGALSRCRSPMEASQQFAIDRDGFVLGEGAAALVLEDLDAAKNRGARILAEVRAWCSVSSAFHMTRMRTDGTDLVRLINQVFCEAGMQFSDLDLIDAHGTATEINDEAEINAVLQVFSESHPRLVMTRQKANFGHLLGASNAVELVGVCRFMSSGVVPAFCGDAVIDPRVKHFINHGKALEKPISLALKLSSSFSGIHTALLLCAPT